MSYREAYREANEAGTANAGQQHIKEIEGDKVPIIFLRVLQHQTVSIPVLTGIITCSAPAAAGYSTRL